MDPRIYKKGFTLAEVLIALVFVGLGVALITGLGQQLAQLSRRSSQTGAILEIRSMTNSITRNSDSWLSKMRSSQHTNGIFAGCIPDPKANVSSYSCPSVDSSLLSNDAKLSEISGGYFHAMSAPIVNSAGEKIAGTTAEPTYLTLEGLPCKESDLSKCYFKSTGFFMRSNSQTNQSPGSIKFVIKVEKNPLNTSGGAAMKAQYMSIDIGETWKDPLVTNDQLCPGNTVKIGYLSNGSPYCINPASPCTASDEIAVGVSPTGSTICEKFPACTNPTDGFVLDPSTKKLTCSAPTAQCGPNKVFLGYFAGNGDPVCTGLSMRCSSNQIQVGIAQTGDSISAECSSVPPCTDADKRLVFNGTAFECTNVSASSISCGPNQLLTGISSTGQPNCVNRAPASTCTVGQYVQNIDANGNAVCADAPTTTTTGGTSTTTGGLVLPLSCEEGEYMKGILADGTADCMPLPEDPPVEQVAGQMLNFNQALPANGVPLTCKQSTTVNNIERSCSGYYYKCEYKNGTGGMGWYFVNRANNVNHSACSSGITYGTTAQGSVDISIWDPLPAGITPSSHHLTCRYTFTTEYRCENFINSIPVTSSSAHSPTGVQYNTVTARIPAAKSAPALCYRTTLTATTSRWITMRKRPTTGAVWAEIFCSSGLRATHKTNP